MRHRKRGRRLGRSASHRRALMRNLASSLFLTERDAESEDNEPKVKGRVVTTLHKAKEVRPLVEKCVTIARKSMVATEAADEYAIESERGSDEWKSWRKSEQWQKWNAAIAPAVAARRRALKLLGDKQAVSVLFEEVAPRYADRPGGYTRILRLAKPRLGDAGEQAILEFVGVHDRIPQKSEKPEFDTEDDDTADAEEVSEDNNDSEELGGESQDVESSESPAEDDNEDTENEDKK